MIIIIIKVIIIIMMIITIILMMILVSFEARDYAKARWAWLRIQSRGRSNTCLKYEGVAQRL